MGTHILPLRHCSRREFTPPGMQQGAAAHNGQILVMFAFMLVVMLGALGLAVDLGVAFSQRRTMQAAADAGALAGAQIIAKSNTAAPISVLPGVTAIVNANTMNFGAITEIRCSYVNDGGGEVADCAAAVPPGATGVRISITESHPTFFIKVVPGGPDSVSTGANARANIRKITGFSDGPFLPCAQKTKLVNGGTMDIWDMAANKINPAAFNKQFKIHGPQIEKCGIQPSSYKGLAMGEENWGRVVGDWFIWDTGDKAGPTRMDVQGADGCLAGQIPKNCVMFLPIITDEGQPLHSSDHRAKVVAIVPFYITQPNSNEHYGTPLEEYVVAGSGDSGEGGWDPTYEGPIAIRMTE